MLRRSIRRLLRQMGWDLQRVRPSNDASSQLLAALNHVKVDLVFDIGASVGQFAQRLRFAGYKGQIVSFEPLSTSYTLLSEASAADSNWFVHSRTAVGNRNGEITINVAGNSDSSSILPMLEAHTAAVPGSAYIKTERAPIIRLDSVVSRYFSANSRCFIKIDTQGFEWQVLDGASDTLKEAQGVLCELSLVPLYQGQRLWGDVISRLEMEGFTLWAIQKGFTDSRNGRSLQVDAIFLRVD